MTLDLWKKKIKYLMAPKTFIKCFTCSKKVFLKEKCLILPVILLTSLNFLHFLFSDTH